MSKNTIKELASTIVDRHSLNQSDAESFVDSLFKLVFEALDADKIVKVKGLGTFKIIEVQERESVNVNTGERVVIEGHGKINFIPDNSMKDLVNKPFAQFETVIVNDGVDFNVIDDKEDNNDASILEQIDDNIFSANIQSPVEEKTVAPIQQLEDEEEQKPEEKLVQKSEAEPEEVDKEVIQEVTQEVTQEVIQEETSINENVEENAKESLKEDSDEDSTVELIPEESSEEEHFELVDFSETEDESETEKPVAEQTATEEVKSDTVQEEIAEEEKSTEKEDAEETDDEVEHKSNIGRIALSVFFAILLFVAGYFVGQYVPISSLANIGTASVAEKTAKPVPVKKPVKKTDKNVIKAEPREQKKQPSTVKDVPKPIAKTVDAKAPEQSSDIYDKKSVQVRTGAYRIIGMSKTVTLKSDESLKRFSDRTLGPGMECYIIAFNDLDGSTTVKKGQIIKIPKLELRHHKSR